MGGRARSAAGRGVSLRAQKTVTIRAARAADLLRIATIEQESFSDPWTYDALATAMALPHVRFLVAEEGGGAAGRLLGYVVALVMGDEGEIADLAVDPVARRHGIGAMLLARMEDDVTRAGVRTLFLEVRESNGAALGLYGARGFQPVGRRRAYYRVPVEDALVLKRELNTGDA
jgi:ribosomal-protein-alanine N-acetyltransferase